MRRLLVFLSGAILLGLPACTTKSTADAKARAAFIAGQQHAVRAQIYQASMVNVVGPVRNPNIPWNEDLTLAKALILAEYLPPGEPSLFVVLRHGQTLLVHPKQLLAGEDFALEAGDVVEVKP